MPLLKGQANIGKNMQELMKPAQSPARRKAIATLAKKHGISRSEAQHRQAVAIAYAQARKK